MAVDQTDFQKFVKILGVKKVIKIKVGGGALEDKFVVKVTDKKHKSGDWFQTAAKQKQNVTEWDLEKVEETTAMVQLKATDQQVVEVKGEVDEVDEIFPMELPVDTLGVSYNLIDMKSEWDLPDLQSIKKWQDNVLIDWNYIYAPTSKMRIRSRESFQRVMTVTKIVMTKYPKRAVPVMTAASFQTLNAVTMRLGNVIKYRKITPNPLKTIRDITCLFHKNYKAIAKTYQQLELNITPSKVKNWIDKCNAPKSVHNELIEYFTKDMLTRDFNLVNVHPKLESLLKEETPENFRQTKTRIIVWQHKFIAAMVSELFVEIKSRLKELLGDKILYVDGMTPDQINRVIRNKTGVAYFYENDLKQQDKQTDKPILRVEMALYKFLGLSENVLDWWQHIHEEWKFKSKDFSGWCKEMRLTGQATTALGNFITNLQLHAKIIKENWSKVELVLFLGDDMLMLLNKPIEDEKLRRYIKTHFNMYSIGKQSREYGTFCSMICYKTDGDVCELGPDFVRLCYRYEVTNGSSQATEENLSLRAMSYLMMIGKMPAVDEIIESKSYPILPLQWYSMPHCVTATAKKYEMTEEQVEMYISKLLEMIRNPIAHHKEFLLTNTIR